jgi:hypothetical protein
MSEDGRPIDRLQAAIAAGLAALVAISLGWAVFGSDDIPFVRRGGGPGWVGAPVTTTSNLIGVNPQAVPTYTFVKRFSVQSIPASAPLEARGLRELELELNGQRLLPDDDRTGWRDPLELDVAGALREGRNELRAGVRNVRGPALLQLSLQLGERVIETDEDWSVVPPGSNSVRASWADDTGRHPETRLIPQPGQVLQDEAVWVIAVFLACTFVAALGGRLLGPGLRAASPRIVLAAVTLFWLLVFALKSSHLPVMLGFDVPAHLRYIDLILEQHALPLASEGFSNYHPPVFHALTALLVGVLDVSRESDAGQVVYRLIPFFAGLSGAWLGYGASRLLWPKDHLRQCLTTAVAGLLPMNVYMSAYVSNEPLHTAWVGGAVYASLSIVLAAKPSTRTWGALAILLGLAMLTKFTSLMIAPILLAFAGARLWLVDGEPFARAARPAAAAALGALVIAGWFYARNWVLFGNPVVWNLNVPGAPTWWMQPGFHTTNYFTSFGEALRHPFFAGFASFWDGIYSTLWGDGLVGGMIRISTRHGGWNYDFMSLGYWMAFPATVLIAVGFLRTARDARFEPDSNARLALTMIVTLLFCLSYSLFFINLRLPFYAQAKAFYVLAALVPLSLVAAVGLAWIPERLADPRLEPIRAVYFGWLGTLGCVIVASFIG